MKYIYATALSFALLVPHEGLARDHLPPIYISEVNWGGSEYSASDEWLELYNRTDQEVDLGGWILQGAMGGRGALTLPQGTIIAPNHTLLLSNYALESEKTTLLVEPDLVDSRLSLGNSSLNLLLTGPNDEVVDAVTILNGEFGSVSPAHSAHRLLDGWTTSRTRSMLAKAHLGTPGWHEEMSQEDYLALPEPVDICTVTTPEEEYPDAVEQESHDPESTTPGGQSSTTLSEEPPANTVEPINETAPSGLHETTMEPTLTPAVLLTLSEIMPNPEVGGEWVELYHAGNTRATLDGWRLEDLAGKRTILSGTVEPLSYHVIFLPNQILNNGGDAVYLINPSNVTEDQTDYSENPPDRGVSWSLLDGAWSHGTATPNEKNIAITSQETEFTNENAPNAQNVESNRSNSDLEPENLEQMEETIVNVNEINKDATGTTNDSQPSVTTPTIQGLITAEPGVFGKQIAFINGYQLYLHSSDWPELKHGTKVVIRGTESEARGERRIKLSSKSDISVLAIEHEMPIAISAQDLPLQPIGTLVEYSGTAIEREDRTVIVENNTGSIPITLRDGVTTKPSSLDDQSVHITGIVRTLNGSHVLFPRTDADISILNEQFIETEALGGQLNTTASEHGTLITKEKATLSSTLSSSTAKTSLSITGILFLVGAGGITSYFAVKHYGGSLFSKRQALPSFTS